jgi:hypothetical protein
MKQHLTERANKAMVPEIDRDVLVYDDEVTGFAICVYRSGKRAFVLQYRIAGRSRHFTVFGLVDRYYLDPGPRPRGHPCNPSI